MRLAISSTALGVALFAGATAANAQTVIPSQSVIGPAPVVTAPVVAQAMETVQTVQTVRTVRPATRYNHRQVVTTRTITRQVVPAPTVIARTIPAAPAPLYDEVTTAPIATTPRPLYDEVVSTPAASVVTTTPGYSQTYTYRYVYEPDRILVIDPNTGVAIQAIPR